MADDWSSISFLSVALLLVNSSYMSNCRAGQTFDRKWEHVVSDGHFDCSEAVGMATLYVAYDSKAAPSTRLTRVWTGAHRHWPGGHRHCPRCSSPCTQGPVCWNLPARERCWRTGLDSLSEGVFQADGNRVGSEMQWLWLLKRPFLYVGTLKIRVCGVAL